MYKTSCGNPFKTCGTCVYRKSPVCLSLKLLQACDRISQNPENVNAVTLTTLISEAEALRRRKYKCAKEPNAWAHLMDKACAFWRLAEQSTVINCWNPKGSSDPTDEGEIRA